MNEDHSVRNFIIIFIIVILLVVGVYFFTKFVVNKDNETSTNSNNDTKETTEVEIDNSVAIVGTMLSKPEKDYYVILYKSDSNDASKYLDLVNKYTAKKDTLPLYKVDLSNPLNSKFYDKDNVNLSSDNVNDLRFGDITLLEVKNNKIVKSYDSIDKIKKVWNID